MDFASATACRAEEIEINSFYAMPHPTEKPRLANTLCRLSVENYKSLRDVTFDPFDLTVIIGPNAAGKSNLAEVFDFVSEVYRHGLEVAVARKGGYENIAHRKASRSKSGITIQIVAEFSPEVKGWVPSFIETALDGVLLQFEHQFTFVAKGASIAAEFEVERELLIVRMSVQGAWKELISVVRNGRQATIRTFEEQLKSLFPGLKDKQHWRYIIGLQDVRFFAEEVPKLLPPTELYSVHIGRFMPILRGLVQAMSAIRVFQISPNKSREFGVPTPTPQLERTGANLPAVVDSLQKKNAPVWQKILKSMRSVLPALDEIKVNYTTSRTLGLFFSERNVGRPWTVDEVSDGTLQTLSLLVAIFDPATTLLLLEEPENSVHPWVIRNLLDACAEASKEKQVLITTHSPVVIDHTSPEKVWVMWRSDGESHASRLTVLDPSFLRQWENGDVATFEYLDSGALTQALPPAFRPRTSE